MQKHTKKALILSVLSLVLCVSMLVGTTFAWFTDSVTTGVNTIQSGTLDIVLEYFDGTEWVNAEGKTLNFVTADNRTTDILWEPGCTYQLPALRLRNNGNLALKYNFVVNGVDGDAKLLEAIEWKIKIGDAEPITLANYSGTLLTKDAASEKLVISGHMKEEAGNEYQGLEIKGIGITVFATQMTEEFDSFGNQYDKMATIDDEAELAAALAEDYDLIVLGADIELTDSIVISKAVTIDLAGFDIKQTKACNGTSYSMINVVAGGSLTVKDSVGTGKISFTDTSADDQSSGWASYTIRNDGGILIVDGGTIEHLGTRTANADNAIFSYAGDTTINGGIISAPYSRSVRQWKGSLTINGGRFDGQVWVQPQAACTTTITDGSFKPASKGGDSSSVFVTNNAHAVALTVSGGNFATKLGMSKAVKCVTGGTFGVDPTAFVADGYTVVKNANDTYTVTAGDAVVYDVPSLIDTIKNAPLNKETVVILADGTYTGNIDITVAALGTAGGDIVIKALDGANPVITGTVTIGYRQQNVGAATYDAKVTFDGITFDHAEAGKHCLNVQDVESFHMVNCTVIGDGEYGLSTPGSNGTGAAKIEKCKFVNAGLQISGKFAQTLVIDDCEFVESVINVQGGGPLGPTIQNSTFDITLKAAHSGESFYVIRNSNAGANIKVKECEINVDAETGFTGVAGSKGWGVFVNRIANYNMDVEKVEITMTDAALAQTALKVAVCLSTGKINMNNVTLNGTAQ